MSAQKPIGRDSELSTTGVDAAGNSISSWDVTEAVLHMVEPALQCQNVAVWSRNSSFSSPVSSDCLRHWTEAGQCFYGDLAHVEVCTPTCLRPRDFAAHSVATLLVAEASRQRAEEAAYGLRYELSASNADLFNPAVSFGSHLSVSVSTSLWENLFVDQRNPAVLGYVASVMASAATFFGAGYLRPVSSHQVVYCLNARTHHITQLHTLSTTEPWRRGLLNRRRESHAASAERLHLICFDYSVISSALTASLLQSALAAAEEGYCGLNLFDPVAAMHSWSSGLDMATGKMPATAGLVDGRRLTLPEFMRELAEVLLMMCDGGLIGDEVAPEAGEMLPRIIELTHYAQEGSIQKCAAHLDWAAKFICLNNLDGRFEDPSVRLADHDFSNTNPRKGMLWKLWELGLIDPLIGIRDAQACIRSAPAASRDWGRGQIIRKFKDDIANVDWSFVELFLDSRAFSPRFRVDLPRLDSLNREQFGPVLKQARTAGELKQLIGNISADLQTTPDRSDPLPASQKTGAVEER